MGEDRFEIELVPAREGDRRSSAASASPQPGGEDRVAGHGLEPSSGDRDDSAGSTSQRRLVLTAAGVGLVALVLGWAVGRAGRADEEATPTSASESTMPDTTERATAVDPSDTIAPLDESGLEPRPTVARPPNASDLVANGAVIEARPVEIDQRIAGADVRLVGLRRARLVELDLATGMATDYVLDGLPEPWSGGLSAGDDWAVVPMSDGLEAFVVFDDGTVGRTDLGGAFSGWGVQRVAGSDRFWRVSDVVDQDGVLVEEVGLDGTPTGRTIGLPFFTGPVLADPRGGVVVLESGRWFSVDETTSTPLGVGDLLALDAATIVYSDCVTLDDCGLWRTDRASGSTARVPIEVDRFELRLVPSFWWGPAGAGLAPGGRHLVAWAERRDGLGGTVVIDLVTGVSTTVETSRRGTSPFAWTDDGRFLIVLDGAGAPIAYSVETGESFDVVTDASVAFWDQLSVRSS